MKKPKPKYEVMDLDDEPVVPESPVVQFPIDETWAAHPEAVARVEGRTPPHSLEAEEFLLSSCMLDGEDVIARCLDAQIGPNYFYLSAHGTVFEALIHLRSAGHSTDSAYVAEHLKSIKQLDAVGGISFITHVSKIAPTTAQSGYFIDKVRELYLLREAIKAAEATVEEVYKFKGGIAEFLEDQRDRLNRISDAAQATENDDLRAFDPNKQIEKPEPIFKLADTTISTPGNLTAIYSQAKTGKSSFIGAMLAAAMTTGTSDSDTLGVTGPNYAKHALLHFDTEQSPYDWQQLIKSSMRRVSLPKPAWLKSYTLTGMSAQKCQAFIKRTVKRAFKSHGGIHSIFIDGIADLVVDPNSAEECFPLITELQAMAIQYNTAVISILHMNPGSEVAKGRGHLGSQLERKAESNLTMEKEGDVTRIWAVRQRGKMISKEDALSFVWSEQKQMHVGCATSFKKHPGGRPSKWDVNDFIECFPNALQPHEPLTVIHRRVSTASGIKLSSFKDVANKAAKDGFLDRVDKGGLGFAFRRADHPPS